MTNNYYNKKYEDILKELTSQEGGLSSNEVKERLSKYGENKLPDAKTDSLFLIFFRQFISPLIYVLLFAGLVLFYLGEHIDSFIIFGVLILNAVIGAVQEGRSRSSLIALRKFVETKARVLRDGIEAIVDDFQVVPGDILILEQGDKVPADARLFSVANLKVNEAALTGESMSVDKTIDVISKEDLLIADQKNMVFKGTYLVAGSGRAIVVSTGISTVIGKISKEISLIDSEIPLKKNIGKLSKIITITVFICMVIIFLYGIFTGRSSLEMFKIAVSLAVSVIPEGLPLVITLVLASGVIRMSHRNALVKKLQAVETLGETEIIAVDKTGTITANEMIIENFFVDGKNFDVMGNGYEPKGDVFLDGKVIDVLNHPEILLLGRHVAFCSSARVFLNKETSGWEVAGDPTDAAMLVFAEKLGFNKDKTESEFPKIKDEPFDQKTKIHSLIHKIDGKQFITAVGAPEIILGLSDKIWKDGKSVKLDDKNSAEINSNFEKYSSSGFRVLAIAIKDEALNKNNLEVKNLTFIGLLAMRDPIRKEAMSAIHEAQNAGVKVVMITGDHKNTAKSIAYDVGIWHEGENVLTGEDLRNLDENKLSEKLGNTSVFARVSPSDKLHIINGYKKRGEVVAMTGDGVNDAPSLVAADLGVAMGKIGTEVAKEAGGIILLDDNLSSIVSAIEEGRNIHKTIKKVLLYLFSTNFSEMMVIFLAMLLFLPLPLTPVQIIWLNLVTDVFLVIALAMDKKENDLLTKNYKHSKSLFNKKMLFRMFVMAIPMIIGSIIIFVKYLPVNFSVLDHETLLKPWTVCLTTLAIFQWFNAWNCRHEKQSIFSNNPFSNLYLNIALVVVVILQLSIVYLPFMQNIFKTTALNLNDWLVILGTAFSVIVVEEIRKFITRKLEYKSY